NVAPVTSYRVTVGGQSPTPHAQPLPPPPAGAPPTGASPGSSPSGPLTSGPSRWGGSILDWFATVPRPLATAIMVSAFLIMINLLSNPHRIWFHWPVAILLFVGIMRTVLAHRPASDRKEERGTNRE